MREASDRNPAVQPYPYDPAKAKQFLAAANFPMSHKLIMDKAGRALHRRRADRAGRGERSAGHRGSGDGEAITLAIYAGQMALQKKMDDIWLLGFGSTFTYQTDEFDVNPKSATDPSFWHNQQYIDLWNQVSQTFHPTKRQQLSYQIQQIIHDDPEWIFLWQQWEFYGVNKGLNHTPRADEALPMAGVSWNS